MNIYHGRDLRKLLSGLLAFALLAPAAYAQESKLLSGAELVQELRNGGYVILIRHPDSNPTQADIDPLHLDNFKAQRQLSEKGRTQAKAMGQAFRSLAIPVGGVWASKFQRAFEAAKLAEFGPVQTSADYTEGGLVVPPIENQRRTAALRKALSTAPGPGKDNIIVSHKPNILDAVGKDVFDISEGEAIIVKPEDGRGFSLSGRVKIDAWPELAEKFSK
jgi:phosphohistidine phosphatase SixA